MIEAVLVVLVPPVAVAHKIGLRRPFWIDVVLTMIGHIPGVVYALIVTTAEI